MILSYLLHVSKYNEQPRNTWTTPKIIEIELHVRIHLKPKNITSTPDKQTSQSNRTEIYITKRNKSNEFAKKRNIRRLFTKARLSSKTDLIISFPFFRSLSLAIQIIFISTKNDRKSTVNHKIYLQAAQFRQNYIILF